MVTQEMVKTVADWAAQEQRDGRPLLEDATVLARLALAHVESRVSEALSARVLGTYLAGMQDLAYGPAAKIFSTESFIRCSTDLIDLAAPRSMLRGREGLGLVEKGYRHSTATTIYGGTTEVLLSMVAERRLGLPRSRSK
jgi:alkylation response protein AidB-like acyl-CoA dehydrogenase